MNLLRRLSSFIVKQNIEKRPSLVSGILEVVFSKGRFILDAHRVNYSFGGLHEVFRKVFNEYEIRNRHIQNVLILGYGSGSVASILEFEYRKRLKITGVEKDPEVISLTRKYFRPERHASLQLECEDACDFVLRCRDIYDLIVVDVFVNLDVPARLTESDFLEKLGKILSPQGIVFFNLVVHDERSRTKGKVIFEGMNQSIGNTHWTKLGDQRTENWIFVCDRLRTTGSSSGG